MLQSIFHPATETSETTPALIMLHGRGADEYDLFGLKRDLDPRLNIYSLRAPFDFQWGGYTWFDMSDDGTVDKKSFLHSRHEILSFINSLRTEKLFLLGFSMGAIMSYSIALTQPGVCRGIIALSGFAPMLLENEYRLSELHDLHIFISHGINDTVIPVSSARTTYELLSGSNAQVVYNEYPMAHEINDDCAADVKAWLSHTLM